MPNLAQELDDRIKAISPILAREDQKFLALIGKVAPNGTLNLVRGILLFWLKKQPKRSTYSYVSLSWYRFSGLLRSFLEKELGTSETAPLDVYQQIIYLAPFLAYLEQNRQEVGFAQMADELTAKIRLLLKPFASVITELLKMRPSASALLKNFSKLLSTDLSNVDAQYHYLINTLQELLRKDEIKDKELAYDAIAGVYIYILTSFDKRLAPSFYQACRDGMNIADLSELTASEKLTHIYGLSYVLNSKAPASPSKLQIQRALARQADELLCTEQYSLAHLKKALLYATDDLRNLAYYYLNKRLKIIISDLSYLTHSNIDRINRASSSAINLIGSALPFFSSQPEIFVMSNKLQQKECLLALSVLPLFSPSERRKFRNIISMQESENSEILIEQPHENATSSSTEVQLLPLNRPYSHSM